jgi:16S rRNA C967 or C1407 C5-methylase (RsmB/RsmF family)/NOL1/NOP2/fmu family ribosome biogenesis protein
MNLPADFIKSINLLLDTEVDNFLDALNENAPVSVRLNPFKNKRNPKQFLSPVEQVLWSENGFYLKDRPSFTFDPLFHSGYYYVQEASSMFIEHVVKQLIHYPVNCLDLCAAPGGKSTGLLSTLPEGSLLVSNEIIRQRANILSETMVKFGHPNSVVTNNNPKEFAALPHFFDLILVDAPCSGEGMFRKDEVAVNEWSADNVRMCAARQKNILSDVWYSLKPGGFLVFSTCTYNISENENNALWASRELGAEFIGVEVDTEWDITDSVDEKVKAYRFFPHKTKGEGLFLTVIRKNDANTLPNQSIVSHKNTKKNRKTPATFIKNSLYYEGLVNNSKDYDYLEYENSIVALPKAHTNTILSLKEKLKVVSMGIELGEIKGSNFIPSHALAMSNSLNMRAFTVFELSFKDAISFLRSESITIQDAPKGIVLLTYKNEPIGFVKNIGNRANNLYPNEWRIRSGYMPQEPVFVFE